MQPTGTIVSTALTWMGKARWAICGDAVDASDGSPSNQFAMPVVAYEATRYVKGALAEIEMLLPLVEHDDEEGSDFRVIQKKLRDLDSKMKSRHLAAKLANTAGRTPEEAKAYAAKAQEISGRA